MAQIVGYMENDVEYKEGPFVMVPAFAPYYRIEVELKGHQCPVLLDLSIYNFLERNGMQVHKTRAKDMIAKSVDWLNGQVKAGAIVLDGNQWVHASAATQPEQQGETK